DVMNTNWNTAYPGQDHGLGWDLNQDWYMDVLAEENAFGHTGYTGTSVVASPDLDAMAILLTNRVHPTRETVSTNPIRKKTASLTASAIYAWGAQRMQTLVESLGEKGEIASDVGVHVLNLHLEAVSHYENTDQIDKVLKHMEGFKTMLEYQRSNEVISEEAYQTLYDDAEYLMGAWR